MAIEILSPLSTEFPDPNFASPEGLLAIGGNLKIKSLINAYRSGIFPWYSPGEPILWWSPDPRMVIYPGEVRISKSMKRILNKKDKYTVTLNQDFKSVIENCKDINRANQDGTWIDEEMMEAYINLHNSGNAHSIEVWQKEELVGGLYGVSVGKVFSGESMFSKVGNASKISLILLCNFLSNHNYMVLDCQMETEHLRSMGGVSISRKEYLKILKKNLNYVDDPAIWNEPISLL